MNKKQLVYIPIATNTTEPRDLRDRFADVINVKDFGAKGDGLPGSDDSSQIQAALDAAGEIGGTVIFPSGIYCCKDTIYIPSGVIIEGCGSIIKRMYNVGPSGHAVLATFKSIKNEDKIHDITIRDMTFDGNGDEYGDVSFDIMAFCEVPGFNITIDNCTFLDVVDFHAIDIMRTQYVTIRKCKFMGWDHRYSGDSWNAKVRELIQLDGGDVDDTVRTGHVVVEDCWFGASDVFGPPPTAFGNHGWFDSENCIRDIVFRNNVCDGMTSYGVNALAWQNVLVEGNTFLNIGYAGVSFCSRNNSTTNVAAIGKDLKVVNNTFKREDHGETGRGVYIWVSAGRDYEQGFLEEVVPQNVTISNNYFSEIRTPVECLSANKVIISGNHVRDCLNCFAMYVVSNLTIENNIIHNSGVIWLDSEYNTYQSTDDANRNKQVRNNIITNPRVRAIHVGNKNQNCSIVGNYVESDSFDNDREHPFIHINSTSKPCICKDNVIVAAADVRPNAITVSSDSSAITSNNVYIINDSFVWPYTYRKISQILDSNISLYTRIDDDGIYRSFYSVTDDLDNRCDLIGYLRNSTGSENRTLMVGSVSGLSENYARILLSTGNQTIQFTDSYFLPLTTNVVSLGGGSNEWSHIYAHTGTVETSDERQKQDIVEIPEAVFRAWERVQFQQYRLRDSVAEKGESARIHTGMIAQRIKEAFEAEGLDPFRFGLLCYDAWEERPAETDENGNVVIPAQEAGNKYSLRYGEALSLECAYQRYRAEKAESRISYLESQVSDILNRMSELESRQNI